MNRTESEHTDKPKTPPMPTNTTPTNSQLTNAARDKPLKRYQIISSLIIGALGLIIIFETLIILEQRRVAAQVELQAQQAYGRFMKQGKTASITGGSNILLKNVQYCWSKETCIITDHLSATAIPLNSGNNVLFDDLKSFIVEVHNGMVRISPRTLQGMFNESVFNYPNSTLRDLTVNIQKAGQENRITLAGSLKYFLWIPFEMDTNLKVDQASNTLVISVFKLTVFGFIPATWLIELKPFNLEKLLTLPQNRYLTVHQNLMMVKPFGLFPPPRINGKMSNITVLPQMIQLSFTGKEPTMTDANSNYSILVQNGNTQFGSIRIMDPNVKVRDLNPKDAFRFSLLNYLNYLPLSQIKLGSDSSVSLAMPDNDSIPDIGKSILHPKNDLKPQQKSFPQKPSGWDRTKSKLKKWLHINN
mgnify:CR=1 FL=1